ncbi:hypothetical protein [Sphingobium aromaticiconvertens]|uniref:hypothetical protein n=1 Tax=Sphingobium aromaticiconvertens TaxID=365341 RepID=UPI003017B39A
MANVPSDFAAWLQSECLFAATSSADLQVIWGALAATAEVISPLALHEDAQDEAERQMSLFGVPLAVEVLQVPGQRVDLVARPVTLTASRAGYAGGLNVFVIGARELDQIDRTNLTVVRRLP